MSKVYADCGLFYEEGWINVDALGTKTNIGVPKHGVRACDRHDLPRDGKADIVRMVRVFERTHEGEKLSTLLADVEETLHEGGIFNLIVPDHDLALNEYAERRVNVEHLFGPVENGYTHHIFRYTPEQIIKLVQEHGFEYIGDVGGAFKQFPAFEFLFRKPHSLAAKDYITLPKLWQGAKVLEIGPGRNPLPWATHYLDIDHSHFDRMPDSLSKERVIGSIEEATPYGDKMFDFVFCAHVFEHLKNPGAAAIEMARIGKCGVVVCPGPYKEFLFGFEERDHLWDVFGPKKAGEPMVMKARDEAFVEHFRDRDYQSIMAGLFRSGRHDWRERRYLRNWYRRNEKMLDVVVPWQGTFPVQVIY